MRKYLGIISILVLVATFLTLQSFVGKQIGNLWIWIILIGYLVATLASWYSKSGFWRKASATILIILPVGYLILLVLFIFGLAFN
ncbi:hypothetical protein CWR45_10025 [Oceanobacillus chungangensis]|uniref:Uncharacterized protein n=1 Tax=Oceanobacillus chungangensis TaxID=1229152 RepID=A0A3D8PNX3_9BACI|nr:hypothetical protein CWR45_10025 [Oceanobacillus chungangensis]